jgi:hypothetical protein
MPELHNGKEAARSPVALIERATDEFINSFSPIGKYMRHTPLEMDYRDKHWKAMWFLSLPGVNPNRVLLIASGQQRIAYQIFQDSAGLVMVDDHPPLSEVPADFLPDDWALPGDGDEVDSLRTTLADVLQTVTTQKG